MIKFHDYWLQRNYADGILTWKLNLTPEQIKSIDINSIYEYSIEAVTSLLPDLGDNPAICFSGGIDSQVMLECFLRAGVDVTIVIMRFSSGLNDRDIKTAVEYCERRQLNYRFLDLNVTKFLERELPSFSDRYDVSSPQFATHFKMFEILKDSGFSSAIAAGNPVSKSLKKWYLPNKEASDWIKFSDDIQWNIIGDFLLHNWRFSLLLGCLYEESEEMPSGFQAIRDKVYKFKTISYRSADFDIIPQETKFTGFEQVKEYYHKSTGDGWSFEKRFRFPLQNKNGLTEKIVFDASDDQLNALESLYDRCANLRNLV